jgi:hypothetical protein
MGQASSALGPRPLLFFVGKGVVGLLAIFLFGKANEARLAYAVAKEFSLLFGR